jgi:streptomycin 6-kinase
MKTNLTEVAAEIARKWELTLGDEILGGQCSLIFEARTDDGADCALKVPNPDDEEFHCGRALKAFSGHGMVELLKWDEATGAVLMPRLRPGTTLDLSGLSDLEQVDVCAELVLRLREAPVQSEAPDIAGWYRLLDTAPDEPLVREAKALARQLFATVERKVMLHADLHHFNILRHGEEWIAIDPNYLVGDPSFEVTGFMRNPIGAFPDSAGMKARLERFAEKLGDPIERLWGWSFVQTVISVVWSPLSCGEWRVAAEAIWEARSTFGAKQGGRSEKQEWDAKD